MLLIRIEKELSACRLHCLRQCLSTGKPLQLRSSSVEVYAAAAAGYAAETTFYLHLEDVS